MILEDLTKKELQDLASGAGLSFDSRATKKELVSLIEGYKPPGDDDTSAPEPNKKKDSKNGARDSIQTLKKFDKFK